MLCEVSEKLLPERLDVVKKEFAALLGTETKRLFDEVMAKVDEKITAQVSAITATMTKAKDEEKKTRDALSKQLQDVLKWKFVSYVFQLFWSTIHC